MPNIHLGRFTAQIEGDFVVFLVGMRINRLWAFRKWMPVASAMRPMVEHLLKNKHLGLLHAEMYLYWRGAALVQYWRSFEQLEHYARDSSLQANQFECVYGNMPRMGLAAAGSHVPATGRRETAKRRLGRQGEPAVPSYATPGDAKPDA
jgi:hypothetical protein